MDGPGAHHRAHQIQQTASDHLPRKENQQKDSDDQVIFGQVLLKKQVFPHLVSFKSQQLITGTPVNANSCARKWLQYQGNCYGYFEMKLTWQEAEIECQSYHRGAHLVSLLTPAETLVVADHISAYQTEVSDVWIRLHDIRHNGKWRWSDESTYNYKAWMVGAPSNPKKKEYCVELICFIGFTQWNDAKCHKLNAYICKHELSRGW
ncbi:C-type lectin BpLec-like [Varanus komodoensis]|uniref:C-type lectin BpLec-like n=1 Tax=Varanus komodoensis TaxID=61221 RepID=UPI001CF77763|nr:C-type lectin BpLec-like [Varanus komodoensis]